MAEREQADDEDEEERATATVSVRTAENARRRSRTKTSPHASQQPLSCGARVDNGTTTLAIYADSARRRSRVVGRERARWQCQREWRLPRLQGADLLGGWSARTTPTARPSCAAIRASPAICSRRFVERVEGFVEHPDPEGPTLSTNRASADAVALPLREQARRQVLGDRAGRSPVPALRQRHRRYRAGQAGQRGRRSRQVFDGRQIRPSALPRHGPR